MNILNLNNDQTFTKFHSAELQRAFRELNPKEFMAFTVLTRLILQFNCKKNYRSISFEDLQKEIPTNISIRALKTYVKSLLDKGFITKFKNSETGVNVYSLTHPPKNSGYSKIDNFVLTQIAELIHNEFNFKLYLLIYSGITHFNQTTFRKYFSDFISLMGLTDSRNNRNSIKNGITALRSLSLIAVNEFQRSKLDRKRFSIKISFFWKDIIPVVSNVQNYTTESAKKGIGECKNLQTYKKKTVLKNKINSNSIFSLPTFGKTPSTVSTQNKAFVFDLNFYGLDKLNNPMTIWSVKNILAKNTNLTIDQIKFSIKRFSEYYNSKLWNKEVSDPVAFLANHLINFGEYIPPETFLQNEHKSEQTEKTEDFVTTFKTLISPKVFEKVSNTPPKSIPVKLREKYVAKAQQEILNFSQNRVVANNERIVFQRALNLYLSDYKN